MKRPVLSYLLLLALALSSGGCSHYSQSSRQQRAYAKYVRNSSLTRQKQRSLLTPKTKMPAPPPMSEPVENTETGPQAMPSDGSN